MSNRSYLELITIPTFEERFDYLQLKGAVGKETFGYDRYLNQILYNSRDWRRFRDKIIVRDNGCDLAIDDRIIYGKILIHHMNPITDKDLFNLSDILLDPEYLICVSHNTHNAIHYGDGERLVKDPIVRTKNDTCPWKL